MMKNFNYFCLGLLISVGLFFVPFAYAQVNTTTTQGIIGDIVRNASGVTVNAVGTGAVATRTGDVLVQPSGLRVPVSARATIPNSSIARALGKVGARTIPVVGQAVVLADLADLLGQAYRINNERLEKKDSPGIATDPPGTGYQYNQMTVTRARSPQESCTKLMNHWWGISPSYHAEWQIDSYLNGTNCTVRIRVKNNLSNAQYPYGTLSVQKIADFYVPDYSPAPDTLIEADLLFRFQNGVSSADGYQALRRGESVAGASWPADYKALSEQTPLTIDAPQVTSAPRVTGTTTRTNPDGSTDTTTTTETTTVKPVTTGTTVGDSKTTFPTTTTTTTTTTNNVTNNTTTTVTTVNNPETTTKDDQDYTFTDSSMPAQPKLYERKYPDGIAGVWRDNKPNLSGTQFWQGIRGMFPDLGSGGACPSWSLNFDVLPGASFGSVPFDVPCWIYQAIGLILLTTAAFTARKIII